jgi:hypothetical protein
VDRWSEGGKMVTSVTRRVAASIGVISVCLSTTPASAAPGAPPAEELPPVRVRNIGLHIGGGPNDAATKGPFLRQLAAEFDSFRRCYSTVETPGARGTFGIDLLVPKEGGHAAASNPRTNLKGAAFHDCMVTAFESVSFERPKHGATKLSYALAFEPD